MLPSAHAGASLRAHGRSVGLSINSRSHCQSCRMPTLVLASSPWSAGLSVGLSVLRSELPSAHVGPRLEPMVGRSLGRSLGLTLRLTLRRSVSRSHGRCSRAPTLVLASRCHQSSSRRGSVRAALMYVLAQALERAVPSESVVLCLSVLRSLGQCSRAPTSRGAELLCRACHGQACSAVSGHQRLLVIPGVSSTHSLVLNGNRLAILMGVS